MVWSGPVWSVMLWDGMAWCGMGWDNRTCKRHAPHGIVSYGVVCVLFLSELPAILGFRAEGNFSFEFGLLNSRNRSSKPGETRRTSPSLPAGVFCTLGRCACYSTTR